MSTKEIKWTMFVIAAIGNFIAMLDSTTVNLALYPMSVDLNVSMGEIQWVMVAYMLVLTVFYHSLASSEIFFLKINFIL